MYLGTRLIYFMQNQNQLKKQAIFQKAEQQEMIYIPINENQELVEKLAYLTKSQAVIMPRELLKYIQLW